MTFGVVEGAQDGLVHTPGVFGRVARHWDATDGIPQQGDLRSLSDWPRRGTCLPRNDESLVLQIVEHQPKAFAVRRDRRTEFLDGSPWQREHQSSIRRPGRIVVKADARFRREQLQ